MVEVDIPESLFEEEGRQMYGAKLLEVQVSTNFIILLIQKSAIISWEIPLSFCNLLKWLRGLYALACYLVLLHKICGSGTDKSKKNHEL